MKHSFTITPRTAEGEYIVSEIARLLQVAETAGMIALQSARSEYVTLGDLQTFAESRNTSPATIRGAWSFLLRDASLSRELGGKRHRGNLLVRHHATGRKRDLYLQQCTLADRKELTKSLNAGEWEIGRESLKPVIRMLLDARPKGPNGRGSKWLSLFEAWLPEL